MNLQFFLEKLRSSDEYKQFTSHYADAYLCSGFFILGGDEGNKYHIDYYCPKDKQMFSFQLEEGIRLVPVEMLKKPGDKQFIEPTKLLGKSALSFQEIENMILDEMEKKGINKKLQKIIISLQNIKGKDVFICTIFISGFGLLKIDIDDAERKITHFEKRSFFDFIRRE